MRLFSKSAPVIGGIPGIPAVGSKEELAHIAQEMYKRNAELADRNKTLSLLRKIDEIILSSITDTKVIAQQVTNLLVTEAEVKVAAILLVDPVQKTINSIAFSESPELVEAKKAYPNLQPLKTIPLFGTQSLAVQAIKERQVKTTGNLAVSDLYAPPYEPLGLAQSQLGIKSGVIFPLAVRQQTIGAINIGLGEAINELSEFRRDLLYRLANVIGIAMDNALLYNEVQVSNEKLKLLDNLKDDFVSVASHELRTPMTAIRSYVWMALNRSNTPLSDQLKRYLTRTLLSTERLINLVNDLLNISRIESGRVEILPTAFNLLTLIDDSILEITPQANEKGVTINILQIQIPQVFADPDKVHQVLLNLLGNALKFTPAEGTITVSFFTDGMSVETSIKDTGVGISEDDLSKLFTKFGRLDSSYVASATSGGTGLGLYISRILIDLMKGKIWGESAGVNKGATFKFSLPAATPETINQADKFTRRFAGEVKYLEPVTV